VDERDGAAAPSLALADRVGLCARHAAVGADGVLTLLPPTTTGALLTMHVTNADGSVPEMCGNGLRCVAQWMLEHRVVKRDTPFLVDTGAGALECTVTQAGVRVEMGPAFFDDVAEGGRWLAQPLDDQGQTFVSSAVSMGNPHLVLFVEGEGPDGLRALASVHGPPLEHHPRFVHRTNVGFCAVRGETELDLVVFERGVGITEACGTGACGAAAAGVATGRCPADTPIRVNLPGGPLTITVPALREDGAQTARAVLMEGPARRVFRGEILV
jgi:diaminopimelate epimerase